MQRYSDVATQRHSDALQPLGSLLGHLRVLLGASWDLLKRLGSLPGLFGRLGSLRGLLRASWKALGKLLTTKRLPKSLEREPKTVREAPKRLFFQLLLGSGRKKEVEGQWGLLKASWERVGASWGALGTLLAALGGTRAVPTALLGCLGEDWDAFQCVLQAPRSG